MILLRMLVAGAILFGLPYLAATMSKDFLTIFALLSVSLFLIAQVREIYQVFFGGLR